MDAHHQQWGHRRGAARTSVLVLGPHAASGSTRTLKATCREPVGLLLGCRRPAVEGHERETVRESWDAPLCVWQLRRGRVGDGGRQRGRGGGLCKPAPPPVENTPFARGANYSKDFPPNSTIPKFTHGKKRDVVAKVRGPLGVGEALSRSSVV